MSGGNNRGAQQALLRLLQRQERITAPDLQRIEDALQKKGSPSLFELLEREGIITEKDLAVLIATTLRLRLVDLTSYPLDAQIARELKEQIAIKYEIVPIRIDGGTIEVATANPLDLEGLKAVEFATGKRVQPVVATRLEVHDALAHAYRLQESLEQFLQHVPDEQAITLSELQEPGTDLRTIVREAELPPVVKLADLILIEGIKSRASDVHVEPGTDGVAVRYRIDGILEESFRFPKWVQSALTARLKVMAKLDITERRVPQDGRIQLRYADRLVDLRVSSLPAQHGEKITLRILDASSAMHALDRIGLSGLELQRVRDATRRPEGLILVTGPTGSGKTTTLYALLREKISPNINIVTIENPIEYQLKGINQVEVNDKQGLTFAGVLRSVLRQDPDVILIGEIRDKETAQIAFQAAQTGHLVLSTVHTNDAAAAVTRLVDLGIEPYVIGGALNLVVAQRLVRRVCPACSAPVPPSDDAVRLLRLPTDTELRRGTGCNSCRQTGFAGRTGIYEVVPISQTIAKMIETSGGAETLVRQQARTEGARPLLEDAREKMLAGVTTDSEVLRVVQVNEQGPSCPGCKQDIDDDYAVCPHCGTVLRAVCAGCGKHLAAGWTSCPYCGAKHEATVAAGADRVASDAAPSGHHRTYKALVADDNAAIRDIVRLTLERSKLGLTVVAAENGKEALDLIAVERPDVLILDLQMPELDGYEVCKRLRSDVRTAFIPVLMLTAQTGEESVAKGFAAGTDDYMTKPFRRDDLIVRVRRMLERTYGKDAGTGGRAEAARATATAATASATAVPLVEPRPGEAVAPRRVADDVAGTTGAVAAAQQHAIETLLAQLTADKEALSASVKRCEEQLAALGRRLDAETAQRSELTSQVTQTIEAQLADIRRTVAQIRDEQQGALDDLRDKNGRTKVGTRAESAAKR